jgi:hypothetical protein
LHYTLLFWPNIPLFMCCRTFLPYIPLFLCCRRAKTQWLSSFKAMAINRGPWVLSKDPNLSVVCSSRLPSVNLKHSIFSSRIVKRSQIYFFEWYLGDRYWTIGAILYGALNILLQHHNIHHSLVSNFLMENQYRSQT